jgi:hypothetical protein
LAYRLQGNELVMTQELIANMLGVRREGVTEAAGKLQHMLAARERETRRAIAGAASSAQETAMATGRG